MLFEKEYHWTSCIISIIKADPEFLSLQISFDSPKPKTICMIYYIGRWKMTIWLILDNRRNLKCVQSTSYTIKNSVYLSSFFKYLCDLAQKATESSILVSIEIQNSYSTPSRDYCNPLITSVIKNNL